MNWKIEPSGVGMINHPVIGLGIQIRFAIYLEPSDADYTERLVEEKKAFEDGMQLDDIDNEMVKKYRFEPTGRMINTPIHNHLIILPANVTDSLIEGVGKQVLSIIEDYYSQGYFDNGEPIFIPNTICQYDQSTADKIIDCELRIEEIKTNLIWLQQ